jgi:membrane-associated phospholipid phosphatase
MLEALYNIFMYLDYTIWYHLNATWHNAFLDAVVPYLRNQWTWAPLYLFLLVFMLQNFGWRGFIWCLIFLATFGISDQLSAHWLKPIFNRIRPCNDPALSQIVHIIVPCGSGKSFPSSHAANHFSLGIFMAITLKPYVKRVFWYAFLWAAAISYAQVYVGVHFPMDVFFGGLLGALVGYFTGKTFNKFVPLSLTHTSHSTG